MYQTQGQDFDGHAKFFKKPWASTALMFVAMVFCLPIAWIGTAIEARMKKRAAGSSEHEPLLNGDENNKGSGASLMLLHTHAVCFMPMLYQSIAPGLGNSSNWAPSARPQVKT